MKEHPLIKPALSIRNLLFLSLVITLLTGCRTIPSFSQVQLSDPDWLVRRGQVVWKPSSVSQDIAGELLVARHSIQNRSFIQFTKNPFPIVVGQIDSNGWEIQFVPENRTARAPGSPPARISWLALLQALEKKNLPPEYRFSSSPPNRWKLVNQRTGESLEGYLE